MEKPGFDLYLQPTVVLAVGQSSTVNAKLQVGSLSQTVEVTGNAAVLETGNANVGSEVSTKQASAVVAFPGPHSIENAITGEAAAFKTEHAADFGLRTNVVGECNIGCFDHFLRLITKVKAAGPNAAPLGTTSR